MKLLLFALVDAWLAREVDCFRWDRGLSRGLSFDRREDWANIRWARETQGWWRLMWGVL